MLKLMFTNILSHLDATFITVTEHCQHPAPTKQLKKTKNPRPYRKPLMEAGVGGLYNSSGNQSLEILRTSPAHEFPPKGEATISSPNFTPANLPHLSPTANLSTPLQSTMLSYSSVLPRAHSAHTRAHIISLGRRGE